MCGIFRTRRFVESICLHCDEWSWVDLGVAMKTIYVASVLMLVSAGILLVSCARQWSYEPARAKQLAECPSVGQMRARQGHGRGSRPETVPPLVTQAAEFALYLDPPKPPAPRVTASAPRVNPPVYRPPVVAPKFRLLAISYYHSSPEKSLAMISEPGKGSYWIRQGDRLGHLVVERIGEQAIFYRDGSQSHQMSVDVKKTIQIAQPKPTVEAPTTFVGRAGDG